MLLLKHFIFTLFISYGGVQVQAFSLGRDSKQMSELNGVSTSTVKPNIQEEKMPTTHHVPVESKTHLLGKREVAQMDNDEEERGNGMYDPNLMIMSKRSAAALNKLMLALRRQPSMEDSAGISNESGQDINKELGRFNKGGYRSSGYYSNESLPPSLVRRGQKERKVYLRCYFNAVSCF